MKKITDNESLTHGILPKGSISVDSPAYFWIWSMKSARSCGVAEISKAASGCLHTSVTFFSPLKVALTRQHEKDETKKKKHI
jgi:hypothetical protein